MNWLRPTLILAAAALAVFLQATFDLPRHIVGVQLNLLPPLMVYASLGASLATMTSLAVLGGLLFDSLSFNPPGISIIPLFLAGSIIFSIRTIILREQFYARFVLGMTASAFVPALTMLMLLNTTRAPLIGWGTLWQWLVLTLGGGLLTPVVFWTLDLVQRALIYHPAAETSFRPDREIRRGRN